MNDTLSSIVYSTHRTTSSTPPSSLPTAQPLWSLNYQCLLQPHSYVLIFQVNFSKVGFASLCEGSNQ